jgi:hypothetical protein
MNRMKKLLLSSLASSFLGFAAFAQGNDCATAPLITQGTSCVATMGTTAGATQSQAGCAGTADDDVWYRFVATSTVANIYAVGDGDFDMVWELFSGTCGSLTSLHCEDNTLEGEEEAASIGGLTIGQTYYLRLYDYYAGAPSALTFSLCITAPCGTLTQPVGSVLETETCGGNSNGGCNATPSPVYQDITCGTTVWGSVSTTGTSRDTDWYRFTVTTPTTVSLTVTSELPVAMLFVNIANCASPTVMANALTDGCTPEVLSLAFTPGTYVAFIAPTSFDGYPCGTFNDYAATLTMTTTAPVISAGGATTFCAPGSVNLTSTGTGSFAWNNGGSPIGGATASSYSATATGSYTVRLTDANGCSSTSNAIAVTANPLDNAAYTYPTNAICDASPNQTPTTSVAGSFSATPAGLVFASTSTGEIDVANSTAGSYSVTYTTTGTCPNTSTQTVVISGAPDATFTYAQPSYCTNATNPSPVYGAGASAGAFSSTAGLVINASTGAIDLASSTAGTYTVTNAIAANGSCPADTKTFSVTIAATPTAVVSGGGTQCGTGSLPVNVTLTGAGPWDISYSDGTTTSNITGVTTSPYVINATANGTYTVSTVTMGGCSATGTGTATTVFHTNPTVTFTPVGNLCDNGTAVNLVGSPAGGMFSGSTGVSGSTFDPNGLTPGSVTLTYNYTDANNCSGSATSTFTINAAPVATLGAFTDVCLQASAFALTGGLPAGGSYSGTGVTGGNFSPATAGVGTQSITYTVNANGCSDAVSQDINVEDCAGIEEVTNFGLEIYPNPASSILTIKTGKDVTFSMISEDGKIVYPVSSLSMNTETQLAVSHLAKGVYFLQFNSAQGNLVQKVIVK